MIKKISFKNQKGQTLRGFVHVPKQYDTAFIVLHGFPGSCTGSRVPKTCKMLEAKGYLAMGFDFSGTNISDGKFEDKLMSQEAKEIKYAIDFLENNYKFKKLILHGHSTGAIDAALYAYKDKRISKLIISGGIDRLENAARYDFTDTQVRDFWTKGFITYNAKSYWTHNKKLKKAFYDEFFTLDIPSSIKKYKKPLLIIHGDNDEAVPVERAYLMYEQANNPKKLVIIKGSDHSFTKKDWLKKQVNEIVKFAQG
jgi:dipeptidyl aminopeptidase/acylaminoacyl peptidase